ncbi:MAG TPA: hypothetical protein VGX91_00580 [Candidatus Cybelea sp.]|jgi:hypothetical protein|nr:hypothetical protein [Candidatus Cybelea sp.]
MIHSSPSQRLTAIAVAALTTAIVVGSFSIVRAQRFAGQPNSVVGCATGKACIEGDSKGSPWGVLGISARNNGIEGQSYGEGHSGVSGLAVGDGIGVYGASHDKSGKYAAIYGHAYESTTNIFYGENPATKSHCSIDAGANLNCTGTLTGGGTSASVTGVIGISNSGAGVSATSGTSDGLQANSSGGFGVYAQTGSTQGNSGVLGAANATTGGAAGVSGVSYASSGAGLAGYGYDASPDGVYGSGSKRGVYGVGTQAGVVGASNSGGGYGVWAISSTAAKGSYVLYAEGEGSGGVCSIDYDANLNCSGTIMGGQSVRTTHRTSAGRRVVAYASESTSQTIEDFGTAQMTGGIAEVQFDPSFAATIDRMRGYYVFLTPLGNTRGLYVSGKGATSFVVREVENGRSRLGFDYRVVAHPLDSNNDRLPAAPPFHRAPVPPAPPPPKLPDRTN